MKTTSRKSQTLFRVAGVLVALILLNIVSIRLFGRLDVTEQGLFTLSDASKNMMQSLDDKVTVKAYVTEDLPSPYNNHRRAVLDMLNEFRAYSNGNLQYEFISPSGEAAEQDAQKQGIAQAQVQVVKEDKFEVMRAYMGLIFLYEDKREVIPIVQNINSLEYDIAATIKRLVSRTRKKIGFLTGQGEAALTEMGQAQQLVNKQYDVAAVDVSGGKAVPDDIAALMVVAPKQQFSDPVKFQIDQYVMRGGKVAFLLNKVDANLQQRVGQPLELRIEDLLESYGLRINADLVRDVQCASINIVQEQFGFQMQSQKPFPYLPMVSDFHKGNVVVKDLQGVILFFASSVDTTQLSGKGLSAEVLMRSSKKSGKNSSPYFMLDPLQQWAEADFAEQGIPLGMVVSGRFTSAYTNKPVPVDTSLGAIPFSGKVLTSSPETRILLFGDGDFALDQYLGNRDNLTIMANIMDYMVDDAGLISIRSKEVTQPPLDQLSDGTKKLVKYGNLALPPALVLMFGLVRWRMRKARKKAMEIQ